MDDVMRPLVGAADASISVRSFASFYRDEYPNLARLAYSLCGRRAEAEEFAQEAMTRALVNWSSVSTMEFPAAWCRRVLLNDVIGRSRRVATDRRRRGLVAVSERSADNAVLSAEDEALWAEVRRLPKRQAEAVALVYALDLTTADAADVLGIGGSSLRSHLQQARRTLAQRLGPEWRGES